MPLSTRLSKSNTEPKNKRAKTERKTTSRTKLAAAAVVESAGSEEEIQDEKIEDTSLIEIEPIKVAATPAVTTAPATAAKKTSTRGATTRSASTTDVNNKKEESKEEIIAAVPATLTPNTSSSSNSMLAPPSTANSESTSATTTTTISSIKSKPTTNGDSVASTKSSSRLNSQPSATKLVNQTLSNTTINSTMNTHQEDTIMTDTSNPIDAEHPLFTSKYSTKPGFVLAVGENLSNQLGLGSEINDRKKPQVVKELPTNAVQIAAGGMHSACLTQDGVVYTFGCNDEFALGRDNDEDIDKVNLPEKCIEISAGDSHTAALSETGVVYAWGTFRDGSGVLGLEQKKIAKTPMKFKFKERIVRISSGADHLVFLTTDGQVYTAGNSEHGQLGRISKYNSCRGGRRGCDMILVPGQVRIAKRKELNGIKAVEDIWTSAYCTFLKVKESDSIVGFGLNNCFQLGIDDPDNRYQPDLLHSLKFESRLKKVIGGMHHTLFLDSNGHVYAQGSHRYGCLGLGKVDADVKMPTKIPDLNDIVDIAANTNVSYAINKHGKVFSWGTNYSKQLGQDTEDDYLKPTLVNSKQLDVRDVYTVSIGGQHSLFIASDEKDSDSDSD